MENACIEKTDRDSTIPAANTEISRMDNRHLLLIEPQFEGHEAYDPDRPKKSKAVFR